MTRILAYFMFMAFVLSACRAHLRIEANDDPQGYADSQVVGNWKITAVSSDVPNDWNGDGIQETNIYDTWSACQKDNLYTFIGDFTGTFKLNCTTTETGSWEIINTRYLQYTSAANLESERFISMTSVQFKTTKDFTLSNGRPATVTKTWTRQQ